MQQPPNGFFQQLTFLLRHFGSLSIHERWQLFFRWETLSFIAVLWFLSGLGNIGIAHNIAFIMLMGLTCYFISSLWVRIVVAFLTSLLVSASLYLHLHPELAVMPVGKLWQSLF